MNFICFPSSIEVNSMVFLAFWSFFIKSSQDRSHHSEERHGRGSPSSGVNWRGAERFKKEMKIRIHF